MEPLDPKAELMRLADAFADYSHATPPGPWSAQRSALSAAITLALAAERRRALEDACKVTHAYHHAAIRALIDGKAGGT